jgi:hypothetical protein
LLLKISMGTRKNSAKIVEFWLPRSESFASPDLRGQMKI